MLLSSGVGSETQRLSAEDFPSLPEVEGDERDAWYARGEAVYPPYTDYAVSATEAGRTIPVFIATPKG